MFKNLEAIVLNQIRLNGKLIPLQFSILEKLKRNDFTFVFDEVGCGKTIEAGIVIWDVIKNGARKVLIVSPSNLVFNWYNEMLSKFGFDFKIIGGTADSIDLYYKQLYCNKDLLNQIENLCIVSYDSRNNSDSNAALDRLAYYDIEWDLIILDEGHESKNEASNRYKALEEYIAKKVLFLSATPIKNLQEDFSSELELVLSILDNADIEKNFSIEDFSAKRAISFDCTYPISRNFKEIMMNLDNFKQRTVEDISYFINSELEKIIYGKYTGMELDAKRGCIFLFERIFLTESNMIEIYKSYRKNKYDEQDFNIITSFDNKAQKLISKINTINDRDKLIIFCNHREVVDYLKKLLEFKYGKECVEAIHGESYGKEERKNRIFLLDKDDKEMNKKRIVILSHNVGSVGINLSKYSHLINYELPYTPADLEQRFGRIDRITNNKQRLCMYIFSDTNDKFDNVYFNRLVKKLILEVLPLLPSKNILFLSNRIKESYIDTISALMELDKRLSDLSDINELSDEYFKNSILKELEVAVNTNTKNIKLYSVKLQKEISLNDLKNMLTKNIEIIFKNIGITDTANINEKVEEFVDSMNNTIFYLLGDKRQNINYKNYKDMVENYEFENFKKYICTIEEDFDNTTIEIIRKYNEVANKNIFYDFVSELTKNVNFNMIFAVLYGVWSLLRANNIKISFEEFMKEYNERIC